MNPEHAQESQQRSRDEDKEPEHQSSQAAQLTPFDVRADNFIEADEVGCPAKPFLLPRLPLWCQTRF
jgi:hypothetical protein